MSFADPLIRLGPSLWRFADTCHVYLVRDGDRGLLIDLGDGGIFDRLEEIGVRRIDWILHTHFHRDQCGAGRRAASRGIPIAVPAHERRYFEQAEDVWAARRLFHSYDLRNATFGPVADIPVARSLADGDVLDWGRFRFAVVPTPGHTPGSITLTAEIDGVATAFTGDLIHSPGKVVTLHDLQYRPAALDGPALALHSVATLLAAAPARLCPSHGEVMTDAPAALEALQTNLRNWYVNRSAEAGEPYLPDSPLPQPVPVNAEAYVFPMGARLIGGQGASNFFAIAGGNGSGLLIDWPAASRGFHSAFAAAAEGGAPMRHLDHSRQRLQQLGIDKVGVVVPTRLTDDAIGGLAAAVAGGAELWAHEDMADVLARPAAYHLPGLSPAPLTPARVLAEGEEFDWAGIRFRIRRLPAGGRFAAGLFAEIDGLRYAFTGDAVAPGPFGMSFLRPTFRQELSLRSRPATLRTIADERPDWICPGRGTWFRVDHERLADDIVRAESDIEQWEQLLPAPADRGLDPAWASVYPYQSRAAAGTAFDCQVRIRNHSDRPLAGVARLVLPDGWQAAPARAEFTAPPAGVGSAAFAVTIPSTAGRRTVAFAADITLDGVPMGQLAEGVVHVEPG